MAETGATARIVDVAREAGVSVATVSRALNGHPTVDAALVERVRVVADRLRYRPNAMARGLRRRTSDVVALVISDIGNPFFTAVARGVEDRARDAGLSVLLCNSDEDPEKERTYLEVLEVEQVAGVILSPHGSGTDVSRVTSAGIPVVVIDRPLDLDVDSVMVRSGEGACAATRHLVEQGWSFPACIAGPTDTATAIDRVEGFRQALAELGVSPATVGHATFDEKGGAEAARQVLDSGHPVDALLVASARMALGALGELRARDRVVGVDIGVIMFDDAPWAQFIDPPMSVVAQPAYDVGDRAMALLVDRIRGGVKAATALSLETTLVVRESSLRRSGVRGGCGGK